MNIASHTDYQPPLDRLIDFEPASPVLVGVSGGLDSVVLVDLLSRLEVQFEIAHVQYGLRGEASKEDALLVRSLARSLDGPYHELDLTGQQPEQGSMQEWGRKKRYAWFYRLARDQGITQVAVAHHADDQLETILLNLNRGSGLAGLAGMSDVRELGEDVTLIRPLLPLSREELLGHALANNLLWREDESNESPRYERNALRKELVEMPNSEYQAFRRAGMQLQSGVMALKKALIASIKGRKFISDEEWNALAPMIRGWIVLEMIRLIDPTAPRRRTVVKSVEALFGSQTGRSVRAGKVRVTRERSGLSFIQSGPGPSTHVQFTPLESGFVIGTDQGVLRGRVLGIVPENLAHAGSDEAYLDADVLGADVILRVWKAGDRFQPIGSTGSTKVKSFLTDSHVPASLKKAVLVIERGGDLAWIVGYRMDERFKVTTKTTRVVHLVWDMA